MKTAIQEMMTEIEQKYSGLFDVHTEKGRNFVNDMYKYLQLEKEQIIKAFNEGTFANDEKIKSEEYYKKTYERHS